MSNMASNAKACFSSKVEYRAVIRYLYLKGKTGKEIHSELADVYGSSAPSYAQVKFWVGEFKRGRTSLEDEARSGQPGMRKQQPVGSPNPLAMSKWQPEHQYATPC